MIDRIAGLRNVPLGVAAPAAGTSPRHRRLASGTSRVIDELADLRNVPLGVAEPAAGMELGAARWRAARRA